MAVVEEEQERGERDGGVTGVRDEGVGVNGEWRTWWEVV